MRVKSQWFSERAEYDFARCLQEADYAMHGWDLMRSWLTVAHNALVQVNRRFVGLSFCPELESAVIKEQERVKHPQKFGDCLGILTMALERKRYDFLGSMMANLEMHDKKYKGQCMTPPALTALMAEMTCKGMRPDPDKRMRFSEPAVGGGAMTIATSDVLVRQGFMPQDFTWVCVDVDWRMYATAFIQLTLLDIPAEVINGNTLTLETWGGYRTLCEVRTRALFPRRCGLVETAPPSESPVEAPADAVKQLGEAVQQELF